MKTKLLLLCTLLVITSAQGAVTMAWDPSPNHNQIHNYILVFGPASGYYTNAVKIPAIPVTPGFDHVPSGTITNMPVGTNYVAVTAERNGVTSPLSNEVEVIVPQPPINLRLNQPPVINIIIANKEEEE